MAYRRSQDQGVFSSRWRIAHRAKLLEFGIPADVAASDRRWTYVLLHGDDIVSGWDTTSLTEKQAVDLLAMLEPYFPDPIGIDLIEILQRRCRINPDTN